MPEREIKMYSVDELAYSKSNKLYFGTIEEDLMGETFTLKGVVIKGTVCPKTTLDFYGSDDAEDMTLSVDKMRSNWAGSQAGVLLIPSDSPFARVGSIVMIKTGERKGGTPEVDPENKKDNSTS